VIKAEFSKSLPMQLVSNVSVWIVCTWKGSK